MPPKGRKTAAPRPSAPPTDAQNSARLDWIFDYHKPTEDQVERYNQITAAAKALAKVILDTCPACADRTDAIRKVREARMTANSSIALHGEV